MTALMRAARAGNAAEAARLIEEGANVDAAVPTRDLRELVAFLSWMQQLPESDIGYTALHYAAAEGHMEVARLLLARGADPHHTGRGGTGALDLAVGQSDVPMMTLLMDAGVQAGPRQLASAVGRGTPEALRLLLDRGTDPNVRPVASRPGQPSPPLLIAAVQRGDPEIVALLLDAGARTDARDDNGWSALRWARSRAERSTHRTAAEAETHRLRANEVIALLEGAGATDRAGEQAAALIDAVWKQDAAAARAALVAGANPNLPDERGVPPLVYAAGKGQLEIVRMLVEAGARVNAAPAHDDTPLIAAIVGGHAEVVRFLLESGADANRPNRLRQTPLEMAATWSRDEITVLLLGSSARPDSNALGNAALTGNAALVRLLLTADADPDAGQGRALGEAARGCQRHDNEEVIRLLLDAGASLETPGAQDAMRRAAGLCTPAVVQLLLERGADPNTRGINGYTPLVHSVSSGRLEVVRLLIAAGADVNGRDDAGKSVLDYAVPYPLIAEELRRAGAR